MKKLFVSVAGVMLFSLLAFAYNPPVGGESIYRLTEPSMMADAASSSGGPLFTLVPSSITYNPALTAAAQRILFDASYTALIDTTEVNTTSSKYGSAFQIGSIIPTKWCTPSFTLQAMFVPFPEMNLGNSVLFNGGISKDVTDKLYVGMNLYTGFYFGNGSDFTVGADLGVLYFFDNIGFLKRPRLGVSLLNLGKPLSGNYTVYGLDKTVNDINYPGLVTPRISFAASLFEAKKAKSGFSADLSFPFFQNVVFDTALAFSFFDVVKLSVGWNVNLREIINGSPVNWPSVGLGVSFVINAKKISKNNESWSKSEINTSFAWQNLYGGIQAVSGGAILNLGTKDKTAPEIILWDEE